MEYFISNTKIDGLKQWNNIYYSGDFKLRNNELTIIEGEIFDGCIYDNESKELDTNALFTEDKLGIFNVIRISSIDDTISIKSDKSGRHQSYYYNSNGQILISNNFWWIVKHINDKQVSATNLFALVMLNRIPIIGETYIENLKELPASTIVTIKIENQKETSTKYWDLVQKSNTNLTLENAINDLDQSLDKTFSYIKEKHGDELFYFGNSGGLDSRLVPLYAKKNNINIKGYNIGTDRSPYGLKTQSSKNATEIAKLYKIRHQQIDFRSENYDMRLYLDIRNNPISNCQVIKNPINKLPESNLMFCGGNGFMVSNDSGKWQSFEKVKSNAEKKTFIRDYLSKEKTINGVAPALYSKFPKGMVEDIYSRLDTFVDDNQDKDNFSLMRNLHLTLFNKASGSGGFESQCRTKKAYLLYYPFAFEKSIHWNKSHFFNRTLLNELLKQKDIDLALIPDQKANILGDTTRTFRKRVIRKLRTNGLNYDTWLKDANFQSFVSEVFNKENPLVSKYGFGELLEPSTFSSYTWLTRLDLLKVKKILDIIYYEDYDFIDSNPFKIY